MKVCPLLPCFDRSLFDLLILLFFDVLAGVSVGSSCTLDLGDANLLSVDGTISVEGNGLLLGKVNSDQPCINVFPELTTVSWKATPFVYMRAVGKSKGKGLFTSTCTMDRGFRTLL